jgi:hypothetical protein
LALWSSKNVNQVGSGWNLNSARTKNVTIGIVVAWMSCSNNQHVPFCVEFCFMNGIDALAIVFSRHGFPHPRLDLVEWW